MTKRKNAFSEYERRRDFRKTTEPRGTRARRGSKRPRRKHPRFVIQQHAARTLHWDFRIEVEGVLKSWAVPKGPSTDPRERRLAVATEDHPLEYADFEGVIPEGEYGAGAVIVWDTGSYQNITQDRHGSTVPISKAIRQGHVEVWLEGEKIRGGYALINTKTRGDKRNWLLVKMKDEGADARRNPTSTEPHSVLSRRTARELAEQST